MSNTDISPPKPGTLQLSDIDRECLREFLDESMDGLDTVSHMLVELEQKPADLVLINSIFRPVHSIKGSTAFFGYIHIQKLAHELETLLDLMRKERLKATSPVIQVLLEGTDSLKAMFDRVRSTRPEVEDGSALDALVVRVKAAAQGTAAVTPDLRLWSDLIDKLDRVRRRMPETDRALLNDLEGIVVSIKALAPKPPAPTTGHVPPTALVLLDLMGKPLPGRLPDAEAKRVLDLLTTLRDAPAHDETHAAMQELINGWHTVMNSPVGFDDLLRGIIMDKLVPLVEKKAWGAAGPERPDAAVPSATPISAPTTGEGKPDAAGPDAAGAHKTMRVSEEYVDAFLGHVGELLVVGDMFHHIERRLTALPDSGDLAAQFRRVNETFAQLSGRLQKSIMTIRKVPVQGLLQKVPRIVRDIAAKKSKEIAVVLEGHAVEVDKSLLDMIDAPLTHMVRNAADHGVETPDVRQAAGKPGKGTVWVSVEETDKHIVLTVRDDGKGLDLPAIQRKAESLGMTQPGVPLSESELINFIFRPGLSTAAEVTDVSGRGVGMDVVKRAIEEAGGSIQVINQPGKGCTFRMQVPKSVTTQIMSGFIVQVAGQTFVLPMDKVFESAKIERDEIKSLVNKSRFVVRHNQILPLTSLQEVLGYAEPASAGTDGALLVTLSLPKRQIGLVVDDVLGVQQVVMLTIDGLESASEHVVGGALMGDGSIALVLDLDRWGVDGRN